LKDKKLCYLKTNHLLYTLYITILPLEIDVSFLVILLVLIVQRLSHLLHIRRLSRSGGKILFNQLRWLEKLPVVGRSAYLQALSILISISLIIAVLSFVFLQAHILLAFFFDLFVLWYCLGNSCFKQDEQNRAIGGLFRSAYSDVFAILFWFMIFGSAGAVLYYMTNELAAYLEQNEKEGNCLLAVLRIRAVLDWVPIRLLGLSFALVGHFFIAASDWVKHLIGGLALDHHLIAEYGEKAINLKPTHPEEQKQHAIALIKRALWLWLIILGMITVALWIG
jgi:AmpE protein